jgi:hypothetical protein
MLIMRSCKTFHVRKFLQAAFCISYCHSGLDPEFRGFFRPWIPAFAGMTIYELNLGYQFIFTTKSISDKLFLSPQCVKGTNKGAW